MRRQGQRQQQQRQQRSRQQWRRSLWVGVIFLLWLLCSGAAQAGELRDRIERFPDWQTKPVVSLARGDLNYPDWLAGEWTVTTTLVDLAAPLAPEITTPGFESNRQYLNQPVPFQVRFMETLPHRISGLLNRWQHGEMQVVADRAFNGLNLAKAYLGDRAVLAVKVDPNNPNRQLTLLRGNDSDDYGSDRQLISTVTGRAVETPAPDEFVTTEIFQQEFRSAAQIYFNEVEITTAYHHQSVDQPVDYPVDYSADGWVDPSAEPPEITADQITAIYLSPQDPDYFAADNRPVALYRYHLEFFPRE